MNPNSLVSISDITKEEILRLLRQARYFESHPNQRILEGKVVATLFLSVDTYAPKFRNRRKPPRRACNRILRCFHYQLVKG